MNELYHETDSDSPHAIWVALRADTLDGCKALSALLAGFRGLTLVWLDERHLVAVIEPGGALRLV